MSGIFRLVLQSRQGDFFTVFSFQRRLEQPVGKSRIFRKQGAVQIGANDIFVGNTAGAVRAVVTKTADRLT